MAEDANGQEKEFDPTPQRIEKSRKEGKVAQSKDVGSAAQLFMALLAFALLGEDRVHEVFVSVRWTIEHVLQDGMDTITVRGLMYRMAMFIGPPTVMICLLLALAAISAGFAQTKFNWSLDALTPKWEKLNPLSRLSQVFGPKKLAMNILLSASKITLGAVVIGFIFMDGLPVMAQLALSPIERMLKFEVSGSLSNPKLEMKHIPKVLMVPFQLPFQVIDELIPDGEPAQPPPGKRGP